MPRRLAREGAVKLVYEQLIRDEFTPHGDDNSILFDDGEEPLTNDDLQFLTRVSGGAANEGNKYDEIITRYAKGWDFDRLSRVDVAILRVALYEIESETVPVAVAINEAVDIAAKYSGDGAGAFINGLLGQYVKDKDAGKSNTGD